MAFRIRKVAVLIGTAAVFGAPAAPIAAAADDQVQQGDTPAQVASGGGAPAVDDAPAPPAAS